MRQGHRCHQCHRERTGESRYNVGFASCQTANCRSYDGADQAQLFTNVCVIACDLCALSSLAGLFT